MPGAAHRSSYEVSSLDNRFDGGLALLSARNLSRRFSDKPHSRGISELDLDISERKITAIIGESGSGKSTLLRLLCGLLQPDAGDVKFQGEQVLGPNEKLIPGHEAMRLVSQHFDDLNTYANVWDNVSSRLSNTDLTVKEERTRDILAQLRIDHLAQQRIVELSGGEKQRVAIARALITRPKILLMDEPFNQVDAAFRDRLQQDILRLVDETDLTIIIVSHDPAEVMGLADDLLILRDGKITASGTPVDLYLSPPSEYVTTLLAKSNVLTTQEAAIVGISAKGQKIAIHPEWIQLEINPVGKFNVERILYRGFYHEINIQFKDLRLRVYQTGNMHLERNQKVNALVNRFVPIEG